MIAGSDCGFGTLAGFGAVDPEIAFAKLGALADGGCTHGAMLCSAPGEAMVGYASTAQCEVRTKKSSMRVIL